MLTISMSTTSCIENNRWLIKTCLNNTYRYINTTSYLFGVGVGLISKFKFKDKFVDFKFIMFNSFALGISLLSNILYFRQWEGIWHSISCFHWGDFILQHIDFPLKKQNLNKNCVSMCHNHWSQLRGLPVAQKHVQEIEHQTGNLPLLWTPGVRSMPECLSGAQN